MTTYHVWREEALIYRPEGGFLYGILSGDPRNGVCCPCEADLRPATHADFDRFRVCSKGHLPALVAP